MLEDRNDIVCVVVGDGVFDGMVGGVMFDVGGGVIY